VVVLMMVKGQRKGMQGDGVVVVVVLIDYYYYYYHYHHYYVPLVGGW